jgi:hypothetical protein
LEAGATNSVAAGLSGRHGVLLTPVPTDVKRQIRIMRGEWAFCASRPAARNHPGDLGGGPGASLAGEPEEQIHQALDLPDLVASVLPHRLPDGHNAAP